METFLEGGHEVAEYSTLSTEGAVRSTKEIKGVKQIDISNGAKYYRFNAMKAIDNMIDSNKYDVIVSNISTTKKAFLSSKVITVQHGDNEFYTLKSSQRIFDSLNYIFLRFGYHKNFLKSNGVVFFTEYENNVKNKNSFYVKTPLQKAFLKPKKIVRNNNVIWVGRHEEPDKGLKNLNKIWELNDHRNGFVVAGDGKDTKVLKMKDQLIGNIPSEKMPEFMRNAQLFIFTSNSEGMPLVIAEALSQGTPVVMFDSFTSAKVYKECGAVKLIKHMDFKAFSNAIDSIFGLSDEEYKILAKEAIEFSNKTFGLNTFKKKWISIINSSH